MNFDQFILIQLQRLINHKVNLDKSFQEILYRIDNWINEGSCWIVELIESQWNCLLKLKSPKKGLINIKNKDQKCFVWSHVRHINPIKIHPERITQNDKKLVNDLNYDGIEFPVWEKEFNKIEKMNNICINVYCYENKLTFPIYISDQKFENLMDLLLVIHKNKSHYVYIKDFDWFMFHNQRLKTKNTFVRVVYSALVVKMYWQNIKKFVWALMVHNL